MGIISGPISFETDEPNPEPPIHRLAFFLEVHSTKSEKIHIRFRKNGSKTSLIESSGTLVHEQDDNEVDFGCIALPPRDFTLNGSGIYELQAKSDDAKWQTVATLRVTISNSARLSDSEETLETRKMN